MVNNISYDNTILDKIIVGRVEPHIYAFETKTVPNYVKVGDTTRPISDRLEEWKRYFKNLKEIQRGGWVAKTQNDRYFRDFAIHQYLECYSIPTHQRLTEDELKKIDSQAYYSREFFKNVLVQDIEDAIAAINEDSQKDVGNLYTYYSADRLPENEGCYKRELDCDPRDLQKKAISRFKEIWEERKTKQETLNLLMYAVMRFGKSITSMLCAKEMEAKVILIVSAKTDVMPEWKHTVEAFNSFKGYKFLTQKDLKNPDMIKNVLLGKVLNGESGEQYDKVVIFLSLQDLSGVKKDGGLKEKFKELYGQPVDMMIIDETHYGARGNSYGKVLSPYGLNQNEIKREQTNADETFDDLEERINLLQAGLRIKVKLHLSGTPYRILMGSEFSKDDIIIQCQYSDIIQAKEEWDKKFCQNDSQKDFDDTDDIRGMNPYFGFPQMIRFAFQPNKSSRDMMIREKKDGRSCSLNELFRPTPITKQSDDDVFIFEHESEVLELVQAIDGSKKDAGILPMLDLRQIKDGKLCHHMVWVLPLRASCDAMETLIEKYKDNFKYLGDYEIINVAGWNRKPELEKSNYVDIVKDKISCAEKENKKTITLTVNRMLTGVTVPEWDTMFFLKEASSPQEYDQAIFRLQSPYVVKRPNETADQFTKFDMKPQTLLVDFDVDRMFYLQEQKALICNINMDDRGAEKLESRIKNELVISPVLMLNLDGKLKLAEATDVIDAIRKYSAERSIRDEATDVSYDGRILLDKELTAILMQYNPIDSKNAFSFSPTQSEEDELRGEESDMGNKTETKSKKPSKEQEIEEEDSLPKRLANVFSRIFFYALLTETEVQSLEDILNDIKTSADGQRIASNLNLPYTTIKKLYTLLKCANTAYDSLTDVDIKIQNIRKLISDSSIEDPVERVYRAMRKFGRLSDSEIVTPDAIIKKMIDQIPSKLINGQSLFLDIAAKEGEFTCALYRRYGEKVKNNIYAIPTSTLTYELTRRVYDLLGMPLDHVLEGITSYELKEKNKELIKQKLQNMKFDVVLGNPPYVGKGDPLYMQIAKEIYDNHLSEEGLMNLIHPTALVENKYTGNTSYESLKKKYQDIRIQNFYYDPKLRDAFGAMIGNGIAVFSYSIQGKTSMFDEELKRQRFVDYDKDKAIIDAISSKCMIGSCQDFFGFHGGKADIKKNAEKQLKNGFYVVMAYNRGHIDEKTGGHIWDWTTLQSEEYLTIQREVPYIAQNTIRFANREEAIKFIKWTATDFVSFIVLYYKYFMTNNPSLFDYIPMPPVLGEYSDKSLCDYFGLTAKQLAYIHEKVKNYGWKVNYKCSEVEILKKIADRNEG